MKNNSKLIVHKIPPATLTIRSVLGVLFRRQRLIIVSFVATCLAVSLAIWILPDQYQAEMKVLVQRDRVDPLVSPGNDATTVQPQSTRVTEQDVNSEVDLLQSPELLQKVVLATGLDKPNTATFFGKVSTWAGTHLFGATEETRRANAVYSLQKHLQVQPPNQSNLITVLYTSTSPEGSAQVLKELARVYTDRHLEVQRPSGTFRFFEDQAKRYGASLQMANDQLLKFAKKEGVVSADQEKQSAMQRMAASEAALSETNAEIRALERRIAILRQQATVIPARTTTQVKTSAALLEQLKGTLYGLVQKRNDLLLRYEPSYRPVQELATQIEAVQATIAKVEASPTVEATTDNDPTHQLVLSELARSRSDLASLGGKATALQRNLTHDRARALELDQKNMAQQELLRQAKSSESNYLLYLHKQEEARISDALDEGHFMNVAIAESPIIPALPTVSLLGKVIIAFLMAIALSVLVAFTVDYLDPSFRAPHEVENILGIPVLASLPMHESPITNGVKNRSISDAVKA